LLSDGPPFLFRDAPHAGLVGALSVTVIAALASSSARHQGLAAARCAIIGHRRKLLAAIVALGADAISNRASATSVPARRRSRRRERRLLGRASDGSFRFPTIEYRWFTRLRTTSPGLRHRHSRRDPTILRPIRGQRPKLLCRQSFDSCQPLTFAPQQNSPSALDYEPHPRATKSIGQVPRREYEIGGRHDRQPATSGKVTDT
jgi:hypothetical protein